MTGATVVTRGAREVSLRFDTFPDRVKARLTARIDELTTQLQASVMAAAPFRNGRLRGEITARAYNDKPDRIAGYVSVFAGSDAGEYPKAATLEYGSTKARRVFSKTETFITRRGKVRRVVDRYTKPAMLTARRYLRDPLEEMLPEITAALEEAVAEAVAEDAGVSG